ncbi:MAG: HPr(Ser) kinase/phosphatase [Erysipelotrichaceae bacterium]|nr:HPr(Ser) kinase/phosphatase [Erysipelotrichaceae bacterium]
MSDEKRVYVRELKDYFDLKQVSGNDESLNRYIVAMDINRPGLELTGFSESMDLKRVIIIGNKEVAYLNTLDHQTKLSRFETITDGYTPCIIISGGNKADAALLEMANSRNFPVFEKDSPTYRLTVDIISFLDEHLAPNDYLHGVMMNIFGLGVLIKGESGVGKSELALELINKGHVLVGDDCVEIKKVHNEIYACAHPLLKNYLEIRGIGIIDVRLMFGARALLDKSPLALILNLKKFKPDESYDRIGGATMRNYHQMLGVDIPIIDIPVKEGRAMGVIAEAAVTNYRLSKQGFDSSETFRSEIMGAIVDKNRKNGNE